MLSIARPPHSWIPQGLVIGRGRALQGNRLESRPIPLQDLPVRENPDVSGGVAGHGSDVVAGQAVLRRVGDEHALGIARNAGAFGAGPDRAIRRLVQRSETVVSDAGRIVAIEHGEPDPVEAHQSVEGGQPYVAVTGLLDGPDDVVRQAVLGSPGIDLVLRGGHACAEQHGGQKRANSDGTDRHDGHGGWCSESAREQL